LRAGLFAVLSIHPREPNQAQKANSRLNSLSIKACSKILILFGKVVSAQGLEPWTDGLKVRCSTN
jgi:hypothetical protein